MSTLCISYRAKSTTKVAQKTQQNEMKKGVPVTIRNPKSYSQARGSKTSPSVIQGKSLTLVREAKTGKSVPSKPVAIVPAVPKIDLSKHETETSVKLESNKNIADSHTKVGGISAIPEDLSETNAPSDSVIPSQCALKCPEDIVQEKSDADMVLDNGDLKLKNSQTHVTAVDETDIRSHSEKTIKETTQSDHSNTDGLDNDLIPKLYDLENSKIHKLETLGGMMASSEEKQILAKPAPQLANDTKDTSARTDEKHMRSQAVKPELHGLETDTNVMNGTEVCHDSSGTDKQLNSSQIEPSIHLCSCRKMKHFIEILGTKLRDSGYDNVVNDTVGEVSDNPFTGAKLVIVCPDGYEEGSSNILDEVSGGIITILLASFNLPPNTVGMGSYLTCVQTPCIQVLEICYLFSLLIFVNVSAGVEIFRSCF